MNTLSASQAATFIRSQLNNFGKALSDNERSVAISIGIARAIASRLQLPTSPVADLQIYHAETNDQQVVDIIGFLNETLVIDIEMTRSLTYRFYKLRYDLVHSEDCFTLLLANMTPALNEVLPEPIISVLRKENRELSYEDYTGGWNWLIRTIQNTISQREQEIATPLVILS